MCRSVYVCQAYRLYAFFDYRISYDWFGSSSFAYMRLCYLRDRAYLRWQRAVTRTAVIQPKTIEESTGVLLARAP